jgi:hypothetical protein
MGRIILPQRKSLRIPENTLHMHAGAAGYYRAKVRKAETMEVTKDTGWFKNIITDRGLVEWYSLPHAGSFDDTGDIASNCCVGTGNTTPLTTDVQLAAFRAAVSSSTGGGTGGYPGKSSAGYVAAAGGDPAYWYARYNYQFGTGAAAGNLTEVGTYPGGASASSDLFSRALILDDAGNPTAITVLSDEILTVTWELRWYLDVTDHAFSFNLNGSPITGTYRLWQATQQLANTGNTKAGYKLITLYSGAIVPALSGSPTGQLGSINSNIYSIPIIQFVNDLSNSGTCYIDIKGTFPTNNGTGTIASFTFSYHMWAYQFGLLSAPIIKTLGQQLQCNFRCSWGRYP